MVVCSFLIVYLFPKGATFKYEFQKGKPWQYASLYAPFDFSILKSAVELENEKHTILDSQFPYYRADESVSMQVKTSYDLQFSNFFNLPVSSNEYKDLYEFGYDDELLGLLRNLETFLHPVPHFLLPIPSQFPK